MTASMLLLVSLFTACGGAPAVSCEGMPGGMERDRCLHDEIEALTGPDADRVITKGELIADPIVRGAAISAWVGKHVNEFNPQQGQALCALLEGQDRSYCLRRLSSPHLQR